MSYDEIIQSSVAAEFAAYMADRPYCRLPLGHAVYLHPIIERSERDLGAFGFRTIRKIAQA